MIGDCAIAIVAYWAAPVSFFCNSELVAVCIELLSWELVRSGVSSTLCVWFTLGRRAFEFQQELFATDEVLLFKR